MERRARRLTGWGFEGESLAPSEGMLAWLEDRLGPTAPLSAPGPDLERLAASRSLPELTVPLSREARDRCSHARGQGLPDLLRLRAGEVPALPDAVARPAAAEEVVSLLEGCAAAGVRVIPRGGGTSVTGGVNVLPGDPPVISLDLERLSGLRRIDALSGLAAFGAGTYGPAVEAALAPFGRTLGHFPQSWELSTLGGWVVTRSAGQESLGSGRIEDLVAGLELVAPAGRLSLPAMPATAAGPDLRQLVMGSEGRLGVVTEVTVRIHPRPEGVEVAGAMLPGWREGLEASRRLVQHGVPLDLLRLSDPPETEVALTIGLGEHPLGSLVDRYLGWRGVAGGCLLLVGVAGARCVRRRVLAEACSAIRPFGSVWLGGSPGRRWLADRFRHPYLRDGLLDRGYATDTLETAAPWAQLGELTGAVREALEEAGGDERVAVLCHLSHPYRDGASLYFTFFFRCPAQVEAAVHRWAVLKRAATDALTAAGGTVSHHHGVGSWHAPWLPQEAGEAGMEVLTAAARVLDPRQVLNPGVMLDPTDRLEV